jgi:hypothetical protein
VGTVTNCIRGCKEVLVSEHLWSRVQCVSWSFSAREELKDLPPVHPQLGMGVFLMK